MSWLEPSNLLLLACALIYGLIGEWADAGILLLFVLGISLLDAVQQQRSNRALAELARLSAPRARVLRAGQTLELPVEQVRLGDLLRVEEGDRVAADAELTEAVGLWLDESLLTGESLPVARSRPGERILAGSLVAGGRGWAEVTAVADATELGRLGSSLATVQPPPTRLQRQTRRLTGRLTVLALGLCAALALIQGGLGGNWPQALLAALALALAVLPNEIPVVLALFLALGALRLARIGVLARWPAAVESLGSATVLAVDKTGTLTENRMGVQQLLTWPALEGWCAGETLEEPFHALVELAVLSSRGDPVDAMELAIQRLAADHLGGTEHLHPDWPLEREYPLQSDLLVFSRLWRDGEGGLQLAAKGAPEAIADLCHLDGGQSSALLAAADALAARGLRVLAVAGGLDGAPVHDGQPFASSGALPDDAHGYLFEPVGFLALADPLRPDVPAAIATARSAGVRVVMITGDSPVTARSIADQAGLPPGPVLSGQELEALSPQALAVSIREVSVFARVMPQQKLQLVRALQAAGEVVAMTGDGVNDAPALKAADIGVAMGKRGTAVARESADLVLLGDTFSDLVGALELGRRVDANLHRALGYTLAIHLPIAALGLVPLLSGQPLILLPVHIALLHLVIDPACTVVFEALPPAPGLMRQPPRPPEAPLFGPTIWRQALSQGAVLVVAALVLAFWPDTDAESRRSLVFSLLLLAGGGLVWLNGDPREPITAVGPGIGIGLWLIVLALPGLQQLLSLAPLLPAQILILLAITVIALLLAWQLAPHPAAESSP
ncbi:HAD-IC family P-type ATPase [Synechococcus sp. CS-1324]|uniref:cation-translocating P-type ATPase n=1 Tax=unclassified Synechococcus TaxID=2626047 RepID=UPI000DB58BCB|nr:MULTISPECIES: HAD-IC family P-type ATPase [unclassified Synechococcus]MCT0214393.1 HAD-IC family P-type ATPase [Synechococcus sp. CS-1326]MCT0231841.1 HAD-IC family P-type ATPase [Synechococcus sp. CS-1324]MCT0233304.1 HAD-IC family P-type ATPase [Synechococcus sp. CS-1327]PZV05829.1 MAG: ATPase [Cyanobium sp.]